MSYANVGKVWSLKEFQAYLAEVEKPAWCRGVCLHHTASPSLAMRPAGFQAQHIRNIESFYKEKGWRAGPHLFTDENEIFGMTPLTEKGIHAVSFNQTTIGIEVLGNYDLEFANTGRGLECWKLAAGVTKLILSWLNLPANAGTVLFHRDDPKTTKTCPGRKVGKNWLLDLMRETDIPSLCGCLEPKDAPHQFVEVAEYLTNIKKYSSSDIATHLKKDENGLFHFKDIWIENAYYDKAKKATIAPISELSDIPTKK